MWINERIIDWLNSGRSKTQLAKEIGIGQATLIAMKNHTRGIPRDRKIINALIDYFKVDHPEVYDGLDYPRPVDPLSVFPPVVRTALESAIIKIETARVGADSPEASMLFDEAMIALGYKRISTRVGGTSEK